MTALAATESLLARIERDNARLHAFIAVDGIGAIAAARAADERAARGAALGALDGMPIAIKDNIDIVGLVTTNGCGHFRDNRATADAFVSARLRAAGAVILGKLNMHEAALGATNDNPWYGRCDNPLRTGYVPGGSSGGSAAAVAAGLCTVALGSDTLGSVRIPAAYCGVAGFKPTFGTVSTRGVMPLAWTLDTVGFLAKTVANIRAVAAVATGFDREWPYARRGPRNIKFKRAPNPQNLGGTTIGSPSHLDRVGIQSEIMAAFEQAKSDLSRRGATIIDVDFSDYDYTRVRREGLLLCEIEGSVELGEAIARNPDGFSTELRAMLAYGAKQSAVRAAQAYRRLGEIRAIGRRSFAQVDALLLPTAPQVAFAHGTPAPANQADLTSFASILGIPAGCVPYGQGPDGLPASMQIVARAFDDALVLDLMDALALSDNTLAQ